MTEDDVNAAAREIRVALLEADVALPVVKEFIESVKAKAVGALSGTPHSPCCVASHPRLPPPLKR